MQLHLLNLNLHLHELHVSKQPIIENLKKKFCFHFSYSFWINCKTIKDIILKKYLCSILFIWIYWIYTIINNISLFKKKKKLKKIRNLIYFAPCVAASTKSQWILNKDLSLIIFSSFVVIGNSLHPWYSSFHSLNWFFGLFQKKFKNSFSYSFKLTLHLKFWNKNLLIYFDWMYDNELILSIFLV